MKKILMIFIVFILMFIYGCDDTARYKGQYPELFSIATNNILGVTGNDFDKIEILDEDQYGRIMFSYETWHSYLITESYDESIYCIIISQKSDDVYSYVYTDYNFIVAQSADEISSDKINELKELNDWNKELNEDLFVKIPIKYKKDQGNINTKVIRKAFNFSISNYTITWQDYCFFTKDEYGRQIYFVRNRDENKKLKNAYVMMFFSDGTFNEDTYITEITDIWNYQDELADFKSINNWNNPIK